MTGKFEAKKSFVKPRHRWDNCVKKILDKLWGCGLI